MGESESTPHLARPCPGLVMIVTADHSPAPACRIHEREDGNHPETLSQRRTG